MRIYGRGFTLTTTLAALIFTLTLMAWNGSATQNSNPQKANRQDTAPADDLPVLDLKQEATTSPDQQKARKHRLSLRQDWKITELPADAEPIPVAPHALLRLPAIPAQQSDAIIRGTVTNRRAILTDDNRGIYSEFSINIVEIFKDDPNLFRVNQVVTVSRPGGAVRLSSGKIHRYTISRQGYPQQGKEYILFLKRDEEGDFSILTGYEVGGTAIQPLDGKRSSRKKEDQLQFDIYRGVSRETFIIALQKVLQQTGEVRTNENPSRISSQPRPDH
jgi:hypothetical protein